jgi:DNA helicase II / ATP-dependent DNA helicase PcrA
VDHTEEDVDGELASMPDERRRHAVLRIFGPPGTGKTTTLAARVKATAAARGAHNVVIASFSVTAAREIAARPGMAALPARSIGTLHSHAFRAIGTPDVALDPDMIRDWNREAPEDWAITGDSRGRGLSPAERAGGARSAADARTGDELIAALDLLRARQVSPGQWPPNVMRFAKRWTEWKRASGLVDFTDMITQAYARARDGEPLPGNPEVFIVDEAQDMTPIETALALMWGRRTDRTVFALDDDQAINEWRGGDPALVLGAEADDEILAQSFRVPPAVHAVAQHWIDRVSTRVPKDYHPRGLISGDGDPAPERYDVDEREAFGVARKVSYGLGSSMLVDALEADMAAGHDAMVLASCGYMLLPLIGELRRRGLPFHNPFRPAEAAWNPLGSVERAGVSTAERVFRYLISDESLGDDGRLWTGEDIRAWTELISLRAAKFRHGAANLIAALPRGELTWEHVEALFAASDDGSDALSRATTPDLEWLAGVIKGSKREATAYPLQVARQHGPAALATSPTIVIGTTHSAKGGTASKVYLSPDLSPAGFRQWNGAPTDRDQVIRQFYVGITRAFHELALLAPSSGYAIPPTDLIPVHLEVR